MRPHATPVPPGQRPRTTLPSSGKAVVLLVDDNFANLVALQATLETEALSWVCATSGEEALKLAAAEDFAAILMDVRMPGLSGLETLRRLRQSERHRHTPIILLTAADGDDDEVVQAYAQGAVDYLRKPLVAQVLRAKVSVFVELYLAREEVKRQAALLERQREVEAQEQKALLHLVIEQSSEGIIMSDAQGVLRVFNPAAERMHGATQKEIEAPDWASTYGLFTLDGRPMPLAEMPLFRAVQGEMVENAAWQVKRPDGKMRVLVGTAAPLRHPDGTPAGGVLVTRDETERFAIEKERLLAHEERERFFQLAPDMFCVAGTDARFKRVNEAFPKTLGWSEKELCQQTFIELIHPDDRASTLAEVGKLAAGVPTTRFENRYRCKDGSYKWLAWVATPVPEVELIYAAARDITEQRRSEEVQRGLLARLQESEHQFRALAENLPELAWTAGPDGHIDFYNRRWYEYTGTDFDAMQGWGWEAVHDPQILPKVVSRWKHSLATGEPFEMEFPLKGANGSFKWFLTRVRPLRDAEQRIVRWFGTNTDIDVQKRAQALQERQARQAMLVGDVSAALTSDQSLAPVLQQCAEAMVRHLDAAFARVWTLNAAGDTLELQASAGMYTHLNGPHARVPVGQFKIGRIAQNGSPHLTNDVPNDPQVSDREWARREGLVAFAGYPLLLGEQLIGVLAMFSKSALANDTLKALATVADAVSLGIERKRAEDSLRRSKERYQLATRATKDAIWDWDLLTNAIVWTEGVYELFGYAKEEVRFDASWWYETIHSEDRERVVHRIHEVIDAGGSDWHDEYRFCRKDGSYASVSDRGFISHDASGKSTRMVGAMQDVTARKGAEEEIRRLNQSLERRVRERTAELQEVNGELESFTYSVSHDLRAPLRHITGFAQLLEKRSAELLDEKSRAYLKTIAEAAQKGGQLVDDLLAFSRLGRGELKKAPVDLAQLVKEVQRELAPDAEGRKVTWKMGALPTVEGDANLLRSVLKNLLANALKYSRPQAEAVIEVGVHDDAGEMTVYVKDNGVGFDMQYVDKLFGVFQRLHTAEQFEGTGIGLAHVRRIIGRHGGRVWAQGAVGEGATFHFTLPKGAHREGSL